MGMPKGKVTLLRWDKSYQIRTDDQIPLTSVEIHGLRIGLTVRGRKTESARPPSPQTGGR